VDAALAAFLMEEGEEVRPDLPEWTVDAWVDEPDEPDDPGAGASARSGAGDPGGGGSPRKSP
jgi:hypothetical protein